MSAGFCPSGFDNRWIFLLGDVYVLFCVVLNILNNL